MAYMKFTSLQPSPRLPVLFLGHGSPMNAIEDNSFTRRLNEMGQTMERPRAILAISAHGLTRGTFVTHMKNPRTIHDFYGFPKALFDVEYPAPGSPEIAEAIAELVSNPRIGFDEDQWGIDHGTWSVLTHLYPRADVPVIQLSIDIAEPPEFHYRLGQSIAAIRDRGVMILGSGNIVHNLQKIRWEKDAAPFDWAVEFDAWVKDQLLKRNHDQLVHDFLTTPAG